MQLRPMLARERHEGEHVDLSLIHERGKLWEALSELIGDMPPGFGCGPGGVMSEDRADGGGDHAVMTLGDMR